MNGYYWLYIVLCALMVGCNFVSGKERKARLFYIGCALVLMLFAAQDVSVGVDNAEYLRQYRLIPDLPWGEMFTHKFEFGYVLLNRLLSTLFEGERILIFALSLLIMLPFCRWIEQESSMPMMALTAFLALGIYSHAIGLYRQACAMAILTFSYRYVKERRFWPFILTVLAAMTFHRTAAVFVLVYFAYAIPINKLLLIAAAACSVALGLMARPILAVLSHFAYSPAVLGYEGGVTMLVVLWVFVLLVFWVMRDRLEEERIKIPFMMVLLAAVLQPISFTFANWSRIVLYMRVGMVILIPELYVSVFERKEESKLLTLCEKWMPGIHRAVSAVYDSKWFRAAAQLAIFAILFVWFLCDLDANIYKLAPM